VSIADFQAPCGALNGRVLQGIDAAKFRYNVDLFTSNCATMSCRGTSFDRNVLAARLFLVRRATLGAFQRVTLQIQGLIVRRDASVADSHGAILFRRYR
jgi:hypothetical protein